MYLYICCYFSEMPPIVFIDFILMFSMFVLWIIQWVYLVVVRAVLELLKICSCAYYNITFPFTQFHLHRYFFYILNLFTLLWFTNNKNFRHFSTYVTKCQILIDTARILNLTILDSGTSTSYGQGWEMVNKSHPVQNGDKPCSRYLCCMWSLDFSGWLAIP